MTSERLLTSGGPQDSAAAHPLARPTQYHLAPHVYACLTDEGIVFLDARRDRYFGVGGKDAPHLARIVVELRESDSGSGSGRALHPEPLSSAVAPSRLIAKLVAQGLLSEREVEASRIHHKTLPAPQIDPWRAHAPPRSTVGISDITNFTVAWARAAWSLRRLSVGTIAARVSAMRGQGTRFNFDQAFALVQVFRKLRCWTFSEKNRCLFNALALIYFLQRYGQFPYFVIGVKTAPFAAHAWVQMEGVILDGNPASVGHFTPILVA